MKKKKKENLKKPTEKFDFMKTNKDNIKNVIVDNSTITKLNNIVINVHKIVIHAYNMIKMYCLHLYETNKKIPSINKEFIMDVFKSITKRKSNTGGYRDDNMPPQQKKLKQFYEEHYKQTTDKDEILYYDKLSYILAYEAIDMEKNINVNITEHFFQHLNKFVNISFNYKDRKDEIAKMDLNKEEKKKKYFELNKEFRDIKTDLTSLDKKLTSNKKYHKWIREKRKYILKNKKCFAEDNIYYDIKVYPQDYLKPLIYIGKELEKMNITRDDKNKIRLFNCLPLRTNIVPKSICLDTPSIIQNLLCQNTGEELKNYKKGNNQKRIWGTYFKLDKKVFKKNKYQFNYMVKTDAISVSILFIRLQDNGLPMKKMNKNCKTDLDDCEYIEKIQMTDEIKNKKVITVDPNFSDLIYCGAFDENNKLQTFRYTQNQRRLETRKKKYMKIIDKESKQTIISNKTIKEHETDLSKYLCKTNDYKKFKEYLKTKNKLNINLFIHYTKNFFRKFKLNVFINTQKSESKLVKNFQKKFGKPNECIIAYGDYDKKEHMKGLEPVINKRFRRIFKNAGFCVCLINEFRTSKLCHHCQCELETFHKRISHKPKDFKEGKIITIHGLLHPTDVKQCEIIHNRDKNAVQNMLKIVNHIKQYGKRPEAYTRSNSCLFYDS